MLGCRDNGIFWYRRSNKKTRRVFCTTKHILLRINATKIRLYMADFFCSQRFIQLICLVCPVKSCMRLWFWLNTEMFLDETGAQTEFFGVIPGSTHELLDSHRTSIKFCVMEKFFQIFAIKAALCECDRRQAIREWPKQAVRHLSIRHDMLGQGSD